MNGNKPAQSTNILILGLGGIGYYLAKRLVHEGYAITTIESEREVIRHADGVLDARLIQDIPHFMRDNTGSKPAWGRHFFYE
jgi:trk system potassium uptake protein TrkA